MFHCGEAAMSDKTGRAALPEFHVRPSFCLSRLSGFAFGAATQALFAVTVVHLFSFLRYGSVSPDSQWLWQDGLLALQFAIPHSILLHPRFRTLFRRWFPAEMHGAFFCVWTCLSLLLLFQFWKTSAMIVWDLHDWPATLMLAGFYASWVGLLYSISLTGLGFQTGWTQWVHWYRRQSLPRREFQTRSLYRVLRHPVYLSFLGLIWFTPVMTADHAVLTGIWTLYIFAGSVLKDQRLLYYLGESYAAYMSKVSGYPGLFFGPLGKSSNPQPAKIVERVNSENRSRAA
jgi:protein-S-isoprenylcysteine O-methyltransferase Ste14